MSDQPSEIGTSTKEMDSRPDHIKDAREKEIWVFSEAMKTLIFVAVIAVGIRTLIFQPYNIPSGSMTPNLLIGDYLFVSKYSYGYSRHSMPFSPDLFEGRIFQSQPERGDIVVFKWPKDSSTDYIKRLLGLPGDRLQMKGGVLYINDQAVQREQVEDLILPVSDNTQCKERRFEDVNADGQRICRYTQFLETLPNGRSYHTIDLGENRENDDTQEFYVPPGHYFMIGDNRDDSSDSRVSLSRNGVGLVPEENLVGRAELVFFSTNGNASLFKPWQWYGAMRGERLFTSLSFDDDEN